MDEIPLFPLHTVLFPGGRLQLRIFEARYVDMVRDCLRDDKGFGICLIRHGSEVGTPPEIHEVGTLAQILDWRAGSDGLLEITAGGVRRLRVSASFVTSANLLRARVDWLDDRGPDSPVSAPIRDLVRIARDRGGLAVAGPEGDWPGYRLAELLGLDPGFRQRLLELGDDDSRVGEISTHFPGLLQALLAPVEPVTGEPHS